MRVALAAIVGVIACVALFAWNGTRETWRTPQSGTNGDLALHGSYPDARGRTVRVMALNVASAGSIAAVSTSRAGTRYVRTSIASRA